MNKLTGLIVVVIGIVITATFLVVFLNMSENILHDYTETTIQEEYTAIKTDVQAEYLELSNEYEVINFITVNAVGLDLETDILWSSSDEDTIVLMVGVSNVGDSIVIEYTHLVYGDNEDYSDSSRSLVNLMPTLIAIALVTTVTIIIYKYQK